MDRSDSWERWLAHLLGKVREPTAGGSVHTVGIASPERRGRPPRGRPAHGDHFFVLDHPLPNLLVSGLQTFGEGQVHWIKVRVDPKSNGVFSIEQRVVRSNL